VTWLRPDGAEMAEADWKNAEARTLGLLLSGEAGLMHLTEVGEQETDDTFCLLFNAAHEDVAFTLPTPDGDRITLKARSLQLLRLVR
jgi:glycogen operon protein